MENFQASLAPGNDGVEMVYRRGQVVCILIRKQPLPEATSFYTPEEMTLQVGNIVYPAGSEIAPHSHHPTIRTVVGTPEVLLVQKGRLTLDVYADDATLLCTREMEAGDLVVLVTGGHGFRFAEDTVLLEVKQGPYYEGQDKKSL